MAVSKIRKASSWTLLIIAIVSIVVFGLFFFGGVIDPAAAKPEPTHTSTLLYWTYAVCFLAVATLFLFSLGAFFSNFKSNPKRAMLTLGIFAAFGAMLVITYAIGSTEKLPLGVDFASYNTDSWLKSADMWLYSIYALLGLSFVAVIWGSIKSLTTKR